MLRPVPNSYAAVQQSQRISHKIRIWGNESELQFVISYFRSNSSPLLYFWRSLLLKLLRKISFWMNSYTCSTSSKCRIHLLVFNEKAEWIFKATKQNTWNESVAYLPDAWNEEDLWTDYLCGFIWNTWYESGCLYQIRGLKLSVFNVRTQNKIVHVRQQ
jgi:hypothetical protein